MDLSEYGWNQHFDASYKPYQSQNLISARIIVEHRHLYRVQTEYGEKLAEVAGKMRFQAGETGGFPAVGDWVAAAALPREDKVIIQAVLPRISKFSRKMAGREIREQVVAANFDTVFIMTSLNHDLNLRRLERYLILSWESGGNPVIVLSKADLCENIDDLLAKVHQVAMGVPVHIISSLSGSGLAELAEYFQVGKTVALLGSSGVGKSTLINRLMGSDIMNVNSIREDDDRGRHTTTHRQMLLLPSGGIIIDTPGMRELQLWGDQEGIGETFEDIGEFAKLCRFGDCRHQDEPGCAVRHAIEEGLLDSARLESFHKLQKELRFLESKQAPQTSQNVKRRHKNISKAIKELHKFHPKGG